MSGDEMQKKNENLFSGMIHYFKFLQNALSSLIQHERDYENAKSWVCHCFTEMVERISLCLLNS
jgi:hypothetical protein